MSRDYVRRWNGYSYLDERNPEYYRERSTTRLNNLDVDCINHIFSHLSSVRDKLFFDKVCSGWLNPKDLNWYFSELTITKENSTSQLSAKEFEKIIRKSASHLTRLSVALLEDIECPLSVILNHETYRMIGNLTASDALTFVISKCFKLTELYLEQWEETGEEPLITRQLFEFLISSAKKLKHLTLSPLSSHTLLVNDWTLVANLKHLEVLNMSSLPEENIDQVLTAIGDKCSKLKKLSICCFGSNIEEGLNALLIRSTKLISLKLTGPNISHITYSENGSQLKELALHYCRMNSDAIMKIPRMKKLKKLEINCVTLWGFIDFVSDEVIDKIADGCRRLKTLELNRCHEVTGTGIERLMRVRRTLKALKLNIIELQSIAQPDTFSNLTSITIVRCTTTSEALMQLSFLRKLEELVIDEADSLTDEVIVTISQACLRLKEVGLNNCNQVSGDGISGLIMTSLSLIGLRLFHLGITHILSEDVEQTESELKYLFITYCYRITANEVKRCERLLPKVKDVYLG